MNIIFIISDDFDVVLIEIWDYNHLPQGWLPRCLHELEGASNG
jgi:hypothetical protein